MDNYISWYYFDMPDDTITTPSTPSFALVQNEYQSLEECRDLMEPFRKFYLREKPFHGKRGDLVRAFKELCWKEQKRTFNLQPKTIERAMKQFDIDAGVAERNKKDKSIVLPPAAPLATDPKTGKWSSALANRSNISLEDGAVTLAESLLLDAGKMMDELDSSNPDRTFLLEEDMVKRKAHVLNVFKAIGSHVQRDKMIALKARKEIRDSTSFVLDLITKAQSGAIGVSEMTLMRDGMHREPVQLPSQETANA